MLNEVHEIPVSTHRSLQKSE